MATDSFFLILSMWPITTATASFRDATANFWWACDFINMAAAGNYKILQVIHMADRRDAGSENLTFVTQ